MFVILGVIILVPAFTRGRKEKKRTQQLQATAAQLGWNFAASAPLNMIAGLERFALFNEGQGRQIKSFMCGETSGIKAAVFDYLYVTGAGKHRQTHAQSVVLNHLTWGSVFHVATRSDLKIFSPRFSLRSNTRTSNGETYIFL
ncbi:MAG TPA: hypothetical protein VLQ90_04810 [Pyrinomonadaceae bacterium]|nr:hypothetical protein [Pyrinomonadaceae bacterium]